MLHITIKGWNLQRFARVQNIYLCANLVIVLFKVIMQLKLCNINFGSVSAHMYVRIVYRKKILKAQFS